MTSIPLPQQDAAPTAPITSPSGQVVRTVLWGEPVFFTVTNRRDHIQRAHLTGTFYEMEELEIIRKYCPPGAVFCDIGANIGNHSLFALKFLRPEQVVVLEPNPAAIAVLMSNLGLNGVLDRCDTSRLGFGLSDAEANGLQMVVPRGNLGGGRMMPIEPGTATESDGGLSVRTGDQLLEGIAPTFLKIDVEGMEMKVLAGLSKTIATHRPRIFIEVDRKNARDFLAWARNNDYAIADTFRRYRSNKNFLLVPK